MQQIIEHKDYISCSLKIAIVCTVRYGVYDRFLHYICDPLALLIVNYGKILIALLKYLLFF